MKMLIYAIFLSLFPSVSFAAWTSVGSLGTFSQNSSTTAWTVLTTAALEQGNVGICIWASDNDGNGTDSDDFTTMTSDPSTTWTSDFSGPLDVENEIDAGPNNGGAAVGIFWTVASVTLPIGSRLTINNATEEVARAGTCWEFDVSDNALISVFGYVVADDGGSDASSLTTSPGATNQEYLFIRGIASETTNGDIATLTSNFTKITAATNNTGTEASSMGVVGEFRILTATAETSDPTMSDTSADRASVFVRMIESGAGIDPSTQYIVIE